MNTSIFSTNKAFLISGTHSGVGKTTTSFVIMSLLKEKGYNIQPFKHGPDFIDPGYHQLATGKESINIDQWMMNTEYIQNTFIDVMKTADVGIVEGMGALFDGQNGTKKGSGAELSNILSVPVILVVDIYGMTSSVNALLQGFLDFDPQITIAGIIFNRAGSKKHYEMVEDVLLPRFKKISLGYLLFSSSINIPERHLGLVTVDEYDSIIEKCKPYLESSRNTLKIDKLINIFEINKKEIFINKINENKHEVSIAVAKDKAFCFYYKMNLLALEQAGARLIYFSPLEDTHLPNDIDGIYFGGGYPEIFGEQLSLNPIKKEILNKAIEGMPMYAECGGFIYLCEELQYENNTSYPMCGVFPYTVKWDKQYLAIKYVEIQTTKKSILGCKDLTIRGQEFHQTRLLNSLKIEDSCYLVTTSMDEQFFDGHIQNNVLGSYIHLYFPSNSKIALNFVQFCKNYQQEKNVIYK